MRSRFDRPRRSAGSPIILLLVLVGALVSNSAPASAHSGFQSYVYVSIFDDALDGRVEYPVNDLGPVMGLDFPEGADARLDFARERSTEIIEYTDRNFDLSSEAGEPWTIRFDAEFEMLETANGDYLLVPFEVEEDFSEAPRTFVTFYSGIIESMPERDALFHIENDWGSATFNNEAEHLLGFSVGNETQLIDVPEVSTAESMREVGSRGSVAMDQSLMIIVMLAAIIAAALWRSEPGRTDSWVAALRRLAVRLGGFFGALIVTTGILGVLSIDLGERLSFALGALGVLAAGASVRLPSTAASTAATAAGAAAGAILAHLFIAQQLDRSRPVLSYIGFTSGAVLTALVIVAMFLPLGLLVRTWSRASTAADVVGGLALFAGTIWLVERIIGVKFPLRTAEIDVADVITSPIVLAIATVVVGALVFRSVTSAPDTTDDESVDTVAPDSERIEA